MEWTKHKSSKIVANVTEYTADLPDGYGLQLHRYQSDVTNEWINEWAVWKGGWLDVVSKGVTYGTLETGKAAAEREVEYLLLIGSG